MKKWFSFIFIIISIYLIFSLNYNHNYTDNQFNVIKDKIELISWIFSSLMGIISFFALFIGYSYENKLINSATLLRQIYLPFTLTLDEIRQNMMNYEKDMYGDKLIKFMYISFLIVSCLTILVWGTAVGFYTKYKFPSSIHLDIEDSINLGIYAVFLVLCILLIGVTVILNKIRFYKNPLDKGYLPTPSKLCDIDFLADENNKHIEELMFKSAPILEFYKNHLKKDPTYEINLYFPIKWKNYKFVLTLYNEDRITIFKIYGLLKDIQYIGEKYTVSLTDNCPERVYQSLDGVEGELKIYNSKQNIISRLFIIQEKHSNKYNFKTNRIIQSRDRIDLDKQLIERLEEEKVHYSIS
ncbi:hypothetical protein AB3N02_26985 [Priestia aryabhattai]|uniref:hypothetical protein n=1 Tax=Priestia aryabhattai TaxID=412384 RepID=UPI0039A39B48